MKIGILGNMNSEIVVTKGSVRSGNRKNANLKKGIESIVVHMSGMLRCDTQPQKKIVKQRFVS